MTEQKWAKEPWHIGCMGILADQDGRMIDVDGRVNMERAASCVNACAGLNPEAIPGLVEAAKNLRACIQPDVPAIEKEELELGYLFCDDPETIDELCRVLVQIVKESEADNG